MLTNRRSVFIEFGDCDPTGIVFNPCYFQWFDASVHALLRSVGLTLKDLMVQYGIDGIPLVENRAKFLAPSRYGDELTIETAVVGLHRCAFDLQHRVLKGDVLAVEGHETRVWTAIDAESGRIRAQSLPEPIVEVFSRSM
jgi:4-hydroxybenzoyl-CoA thioesterase